MTDLFDLIKIRKNKLIDDITAVNLSMFEQLIAMYYYTLSQLSGDERKRQIFTQQMRLVGAIQKIRFLNRDEEKVRFLFDLIDNKLKTLEILEEVKKNSALFSASDRQQLESTLEEHSILYSSPSTTHPFPFHAMYLLLKDPLPALQHFLSLPPPRLLIEAVAKIHLEEKSDRTELLGLNSHTLDTPDNLYLSMTSLFPADKKPMTLSNVYEALQDKELNLSVLLHACEDEKIKINKQEFTEDVLTSINEVLIQWSQYFGEILFPYHQKTLPIMDDLILTDEIEKNGVISIDQKMLKKLCFLGQADQLADIISRKLKSVYLSNSKAKNDILHQVPNQLSEFAQWFKECRMGYVSGLSQLPSLIATMLYMRLNHAPLIQFVLCSNIPVIDIPEKNKVENLQHLVTCIINNCLYYCDTPSLPLKINTLSVSNHFEEYISKDIKNNTQKLPNEIMKEWVAYDKKTTRDRFKRPLSAFKNDIFEANNKINKQKQSSLQAYFPVRSEYPLPFWGRN